MDRAKTVACLIALLGLSCAKTPKIVVASKNFTEQVLLGEILAQQIERRLGVPVVRKLNLGGTMLSHEALVKGDIDLYPEYTGTALTAVLKQPPLTDRAAALEKVRAAYRSQWQLEWLPPLGFNDTFAMIVRGETARAGLKTLSQAAAKQPWRIGVGYEFQQRPDGLPGLVTTYGLRLDGNPVTMDLGLLYAALDARKVDLIAANSTDGLIAARDVAILEDDRRYFPPYECAVVVRADILTRFPPLRAALEELSGKLSDDAMRRLNYEVDGKHRSAVAVAGEYLANLR
jgi:glycine betaine/choline ABC-type transport system substrate-binding protein